MTAPTDPIDLTARLIRCESVTPDEGGALVLLEQLLSAAGFECRRVDLQGISNLFARWGAKGHARTFGFNGHTDVVPVGDIASWTHGPFSGDRIGDRLWGRGAQDMKSGVAAFAAAAIDFVRETPPDGAIILTITGDEEGDGVHGTKALLRYMEDTGEAMQACIVGEPTCPNAMGEMIKIGRRGSVTGRFTVRGKQGHVAYPHLSINPTHAMARLLDRLASQPLDQGSEHFDPSSVQVTTIDTGNPASNVVPEACHATLNVRFNDLHDSTGIGAWMAEAAEQVIDEFGVEVDLSLRVTGESFLTPPGELSALVAGAVEQVTGRVPTLSTTGGTSDARFVKDHCAVVEFGLVGDQMHQVDESVPVAQITQLTAVYRQVLTDYFA